MDRKLLLVGGATLVATGLAWYLSQKPPLPVKCSDYTTETECESHNCYWYFGSCHSLPPGVEPCELLGECYPGVAGWQRCDMYDNLCRCNGNNWQCIEEESQICKDDITRGMCVVNQAGLVMCLETSQQGVDECNLAPGSIGEGCSCAVGECHPAAWCDPIKKLCWKRAMNIPISADSSNWTCYKTDLGNTCNYELDETYAALTLNGTFGFKWGFPLTEIDWYIHGFYKKTGNWTELGSGHVIVWEPEGEFDVMFNFPAQAIDYLSFTTYTSPLVNTHPNYFIGHLSL